MKIESADIFSLLSAYRMLISTDSALNLGSSFRKDTLAAFHQLLKHELQAPVTLIQPAADLAILGLFIEQGWVKDGKLETEHSAIRADFERFRLAFRERNQKIFQDGKWPRNLAPSQRMSWLQLTQDELRQSTEILRRVESLISRSG